MADFPAGSQAPDGKRADPTGPTTGPSAGGAQEEPLRVVFFASKAGWYAIEADRVLEVISASSPARVPLAPRGIEGLIHNKGEFLPVVEISSAHPSPARSAATPEDSLHSRMLVVRGTDETVVLRAEGVQPVTTVDPGRVHEVEVRRGHAGAPGRTPRVIDAGDFLATFLDPDEIIAAIAPRRGRAAGKVEG